MRARKAVDLALVNGKVITLAEDSSIVEAVAVSQGRILAVGTTREIKELLGKDSKVLDLCGKTVTPGFIESHIHPFYTGTMMLFEVDVGEAKSIEGVIDAIHQRSQRVPKGRWIRAHHYDDNKLKEKRHPTKWDLDKASKDHPIYVTRLDGHLAVVNSKALEIAGISNDVVDPIGGRFDRDSRTGEINGVLREHAQAQTRSMVPPYTIEEVKTGIVTACQKLASWGITSFTDAGIGHDGLIAYQELLAEGKLPVRVGVLIYWYPTSSSPGYASELGTIGLKAGLGDNRFRIVGTKFIADGSMSGCTALLHEPYSNEAENCGLSYTPREQLTEGIVKAHEAGLRPCVHAVGDKAIDMVLDAFEIASREKPVINSRLRIEHCTLPTDESLQRMKRLGVIPVSSVGFLFELGSAHLLALGSRRISRYFPQRSYLDLGITSAGNSDWFVTSANIFQQIYSAVTRKSYSGEVIGSEQRISVMDALRLYTISGAFASFEEKIKGSIETGKLADLIVLDRDILAIPEEEIREVNCEMTIVEGEIIYQRGKTANRPGIRLE